MVLHAGKSKTYALPPSTIDAAQVVRTLTTNRAYVNIHIEGIACLCLDLDTARKTNPDHHTWSHSIPGVHGLQANP
jgi:hypothetical protein